MPRHVDSPPPAAEAGFSPATAAEQLNVARNALPQQRFCTRTNRQVICGEADGTAINMRGLQNAKSQLRQARERERHARWNCRYGALRFFIGEINGSIIARSPSVGSFGQRILLQSERFRFSLLCTAELQ